MTDDPAPPPPAEAADQDEHEHEHEPAPDPAAAAVPAPDPAAVPAPAPDPVPDPSAAPYGPYIDHDNLDDLDRDPLSASSRPANRRTMAIAAAAILAGLLVATLVFLGRANAQRYLFACSTDRASAEQGRSFPPWGSRSLTGPEWKPIPLPPNAECRPRETDDVAELGGWYLDALVERASAILSAHDLADTLAHPASGSGANAPPGPLDIADAELQQALLLARAPERRDQRKEVDRLLGDVAYWRATLRLHDVTAGLTDAAKQFDDAAAHRPRFANDAGAWAAFLRHLADELHAGPAGAAATPSAAAPAPATPGPPVGTALPVEPPAGSGSEAPAASPIDAGVPTGGVLL